MTPALRHFVTRPYCLFLLLSLRAAARYATRVYAIRYVTPYDTLP